tara:strand:+ start:1514 stop:1741 length:228 start_codon:yes stop_codon:yes gene_type:complete
MHRVPIEVFIDNPDVGRVVITYLESGYRHPIPMIDSDVKTVSKTVQDAFELGSMYGWDNALVKPAHTFVRALLTN